MIFALAGLERWLICLASLASVTIAAKDILRHQENCAASTPVFLDNSVYWAHVIVLKSSSAAQPQSVTAIAIAANVRFMSPLTKHI